MYEQKSYQTFFYVINKHFITIFFFVSKNINFVGREISILSLLTWSCGNAECTLPSDRRLLLITLYQIYLLY